MYSQVQKLSTTCLSMICNTVILSATSCDSGIISDIDRII